MSNNLSYCFAADIVLHLLPQILQNVKEVPKLTVFFPAKDNLKTWVERMKRPKQVAESLIGSRVELRFVCELTHRAAETGFPMVLTSEWVRKAAPYLKASILLPRTDCSPTCSLYLSLRYFLRLHHEVNTP